MESSETMPILEGLNAEQLRAVKAVQGPVLILAGAGSGKTSALTRRIAYLIRACRVAPWSILAITFTNKAARELRDRLDKLVGAVGSDIWAVTFHAMCARILRRDIERLGYRSSFTVLDAGDQLAVVRRIMNEMNIDTKRYEPKAVLAHISGCKNVLMSATQAQDKSTNPFEKVAASVYAEYERRLKMNHSLDFDDLILKTIHLFRESPEVLTFYQNKFHYVHVDEYQDTNHAQYVLVSMLSEKRKNLCVVGDSDQSIYGWRGADIQNILQFERDYPTALVIRLEQNYRSTKRILAIANDVIRNNFDRKEKNLWTAGEEGEKAVLFHASDERAEAAFVAGQIDSAVREGGKYSDCAVLYRTNAQSRVVEELFLQRGIPYRIFGGLRFYDRKEIRDVLGYLRLLVNPADDVSLIRIINVPKRGVGEGTIAKLQAHANRYGLSLFDALHQADQAGISARFVKPMAEFVSLVDSLIKMKSFLNLTELTTELLKRSGYRHALEAERSLEAAARLENLEEFLSLTMEFDRQYALEQADATSMNGALELFLTDVALVADTDLNAGKPATKASSDEVVLMTLHSAKGLEFPTVFLVGLEEGIFPHKRTLSEPGEMEEERRLCYVGVTRAMRKLFMTTCSIRSIFGETRAAMPSRFLSEMPDEHIMHLDATAFRSARQPFVPRENSSNRTSNLVIPGAFGADLSVDYDVGDVVDHRKWGRGIIRSTFGSGDSLELEVVFEAPIGARKLVARFAPIVKQTQVH